MEATQGESPMCPLIRGACLKRQCMMWREDDCIIALWLQLGVQAPTTENSEDLDVAEHLVTRVSRWEDDDEDQERLPKWFLETQPSDLASEAISLALSSEAGAPVSRLNPFMVLQNYFTSKGVGHVHDYSLPSNQRSQFRKVQESIAQQLPVAVEQETARRRDALEGYVAEIVEVAQRRGLKRLTQSDVDAFFDARGERYDWEYKRQIWSSANAKLKGFM